MRIAWVTRSFLDYRIPVFRELDALVDGNLFLSFSGDYVPDSVTAKVVAALGDRAFAMRGEKRIGGEDQHHLANRNISFRWQPGLLRHIRELQPDVLVCDGFFKWTLPALFYRARTGAPLVIAYERTKHTERSAQGIRTVYRKAVIRRTDAMVCSGRLCREYTEELGMPAARITEGHMSADTQGLAAAAAKVTPSQIASLRARYGLRGAVFLFVGRLDARKGIRELLRAWQAASFSQSQASLLIVGDGPLRAEIESLAGDQPNVVLAGRVPYDALAPFYAASDAFVIATLEDNWSLVVPEAMSCGLPVLSSKYNGCWPELVRDGENGWTFLPEETEHFAHQLRAAAALSVQELAKMGEASQKIIASHGADNAAKSIYEACQIAMCHRKRRSKHLAREMPQNQ